MLRCRQGMPGAGTVGWPRPIRVRREKGNMQTLHSKVTSMLLENPEKHEMNLY